MNFGDYIFIFWYRDLEKRIFRIHLKNDEIYELKIWQSGLTNILDVQLEEILKNNEPSWCNTGKLNVQPIYGSRRLLDYRLIDSFAY